MNNAIRYCLVMVATICSAISSTSLPDLSRYNLKPLYTTETVPENPIFIILVPELSTQKDLESFTKKMKVPQDFFEVSQPAEETKPVILLFDYQEPVSHNKRGEAGTVLASGINVLQNKFNNSTIILIGHGQGANVINEASKSRLKKRIDFVIQLCPPISDTYKPNLANIVKLINFYTEHDFLYQNSQQFKKYYTDQKQDTIHNTKLFFNRDQKAPIDFIHPMLGNRILELSKKIIDTYPHHQYLIAYIDTIKSCADMRVIIDAKPNQLSKHSLNSQKEKVYSNQEAKQLQVCTGKPTPKKLSAGEKSRTKKKALEEQVAQQRLVNNLQ